MHVVGDLMNTFGLVVVFLALAGAAYWFVKKQKAKKSSTSTGSGGGTGTGNKQKLK